MLLRGLAVPFVTVIATAALAADADLRLSVNVAFLDPLFSALSPSPSTFLLLLSVIQFSLSYIRPSSTSLSASSASPCFFLPLVSFHSCHSVPFSLFVKLPGRWSIVILFIVAFSFTPFSTSLCVIHYPVRSVGRSSVDELEASPLASTDPIPIPL